jgi:two-component system cell cycle response regulator
MIDKIKDARGTLNLKKQLEVISNGLPDPVFIIDQKGDYLAAYGGEDRRYYHDSKSLIGKNIDDIFVPDKALLFHESLDRCIRKGQLLKIEYQLAQEELTNADVGVGPKNLQWYEARLYPIHMPEEDLWVVVWTVANINARKRLEEKLRILSTTDSLTGVYNRRYFTEIFDRKFKIEKRYHNHLSLLVIDLDHFKNINDNYGHAAGDHVLTQFSRVCEKILRETDVLARIGGEEFGVLLSNTDVIGANILAERIRQNVEDMETVVDGKKIPVTVSIGFAAVKDTDESLLETVRRADEALYIAKEEGRNRIKML